MHCMMLDLGAIFIIVQDIREGKDVSGYVEDHSHNKKGIMARQIKICRYK